jgi:hypothetical protein
MNFFIPTGLSTTGWPNDASMLTSVDIGTTGVGSFFGLLRIACFSSLACSGRTSKEANIAFIKRLLFIERSF